MLVKILQHSVLFNFKGEEWTMSLDIGKNLIAELISKGVNVETNASLYDVGMRELYYKTRLFTDQDLEDLEVKAVKEEIDL